MERAKGVKPKIPVLYKALKQAYIERIHCKCTILSAVCKSNHTYIQPCGKDCTQPVHYLYTTMVQSYIHNRVVKTVHNKRPYTTCTQSVHNCVVKTVWVFTRLGFYSTAMIKGVALRLYTMVSHFTQLFCAVTEKAQPTVTDITYNV